jgi:glycosyltransferase involved in cell wall biosynthesis
MRILFCNKYSRPFSGTEVYLFELMELLRSHGHEVALFSMAESGEPVSEFRAPFVDFKTSSAWEKVRLAGHAIYSTDVQRRLRRAIAGFRPDVAHIRNIYHHLSPSILWEFHSQSIPVLYHVNDLKLICPTYNLVAHGKICNRCRGGKFWHVITERCYEGSIAASTILAAEGYLHKWLGTYRACITKILTPSHFARQKLIENGWDQDGIDVLHHFQNMPKQIGCTPDQCAGILYFGRLSAEKGLISLLNAMRTVPSIPLSIAGKGPQENELRALVGSLDLDNVHFLGHVQGPALERALRASRFTIFPSLAYETLGKAILESYACGRPVIASDLGSRREVVIHQQTGLLYAAGNSEQLAESIRFLYSQPQLATRMGAAGQALLREHHSPDKHYEKLFSIYQELLERAPRMHAFGKNNHHLRVAFIGGRGVVGKYSGIESYYEEVGERLAKMGHEVTVYCRTYFTPPGKQYKSMHLVRLPCLRTKHLETLSHTLLSALHATFGPYDIVHFHTLGPALFSVIPRLAGKKTVVTVQGLDWQRKKWGRFARLILRIGEWAAINLPHSTMVVSRTLRDYYGANYGIQPSFIPNGTDIRERGTTKHLQEFGLEAGRYILFMGRFSPEKNCDLLIRAFQAIETDLKLVLAGGSGYSDSYAAALRQQQSGRIRLLNWVAGAARDELLTNAMLFVMPSDLEGLSLALLEAMGAGVCVLSSDVPENRELVADAGFTFRAGDQYDLSRMLQTLISDDELRANAARKCQQRIAETYLWPDITRHIEDEYFRVMGWNRGANSTRQNSEKAA